MRGEGDGGEIGSTAGGCGQSVEEAEPGNGASEGEDDGIVMEELVEEWSNRLGPKYQVKVCTHVPAFCSGIPSNANTLKMSLLQGPGPY